MFKYKYLKIILLILLVFGFCLTVKAVELQVPIPGQPDAGQDLASYISGWYTFGMGAIGIVAVIMIMWGGMQWMTAAGNAALIGQAKQRISNAIVGVILALCSYGLLYLINPALVELKMPAIIILTKKKIREYDSLNLIGEDCVKNQDCQGSVANPVYDLKCYIGCLNGSKPVPEEYRKCTYTKSMYERCKYPACSNYEQNCSLKNEENAQGNCCDSRLVCNTWSGKCKKLGKKGDRCVRKVECESRYCDIFSEKCE